MKVISGKYKGRNIKGYNTIGTRPTMDRVKESLFASINSYLNDAVVLDLFAGSGNLGIEALSNGAKYCYFNDINKDILKVLKDNITTIGIKEYNISNKDYKSYLNTYKDIKFDIIFLDPPYNMDVMNEIVNYIIDNKMLNKEGIIVLEYQNISSLYINENISIIKEKKYGDKYIKVLKLI